MRELSYKDTERDINIKIFDLEFKISNKIEKLNVEEIKKQAETDEKVIENIIDNILGQDATKKINEKRVSDGYEEMSLDVQTQVLNWIIQTYSEEVLRPMRRTVNNMENYKRGRKLNNRYRRY